MTITLAMAPPSFENRAALTKKELLALVADSNNRLSVPVMDVRLGNQAKWLVIIGCDEPASILARLHGYGPATVDHAGLSLLAEAADKQASLPPSDREERGESGGKEGDSEEEDGSDEEEGDMDKGDMDEDGRGGSNARHLSPQKWVKMFSSRRSDLKSQKAHLLKHGWGQNLTYAEFASMVKKGYAAKLLSRRSSGVTKGYDMERQRRQRSRRTVGDTSEEEEIDADGDTLRDTPSPVGSEPAGTKAQDARDTAGHTGKSPNPVGAETDQGPAVTGTPHAAAAGTSQAPVVTGTPHTSAAETPQAPVVTGTPNLSIVREEPHVSDTVMPLGSAADTHQVDVVAPPIDGTAGAPNGPHFTDVGSIQGMKQCEFYAKQHVDIVFANCLRTTPKDIALATRIVKVAFQVGGRVAIEDWKGLMRQWRVDQTLNQPSPGTVVPYRSGDGHVDGLQEAMRSVRFSLNQGNLAMIRRRVAFAQQVNEYDAALANWPKHIKMREEVSVPNGHGKPSQAKRVLFCKAQGIAEEVNPHLGQHKALWVSFEKELTYGRKWAYIRDNLGFGILGLLPSDTAPTFYERLTNDELELFVYVIGKFNPRAVEAGEVVSQMVREALTGGVVPAGRLALEDFNLTDSDAIEDPVYLFSEQRGSDALSNEPGRILEMDVDAMMRQISSNFTGRNQFQTGGSGWNTNAQGMYEPMYQGNVPEGIEDGMSDTDFLSSGRFEP